jgi:hypothetical protein
MRTWSPTLEGFRAVFRTPAVPAAEIAWRWSFGTATMVLCIVAMVEYLDSLPVSGRNLLLLRSAHPVLVSHALAQIMRGSGLRFVLAAALLFVSLTFLWIVLAAFGRAATLDSLISSIRDRARLVAGPSLATSAVGALEGPYPGTVRTMAGLSFLRAGVAVAMAASLVGIVVVSGLVSSDKHPRPGLAFLVFASLTVAAASAWMILNWFLSLASIFAERDGLDTFGALAAAERFVRERFAALFAVGTWFGIAHLTLFALATSAVGFPLSLAAIVPPGFIVLAIGLITLAYFALVDGLYIGRLAGYVAILEAPPLPPLAAPADLPGASSPSLFSHPFAATRVDQEELILSDTTEQRVSPEPRLADIEIVAPIIAGAERATVDKDETILSDQPTVETGLAPSETQQAVPRPPFTNER